MNTLYAFSKASLSDLHDGQNLDDTKFQKIIAESNEV